MKFIVKNSAGEASEQYQWLSKELPEPDKWELYIIKSIDRDYYWKVVILDEHIATLFLLRWGEKVYTEGISRCFL